MFKRLIYKLVELIKEEFKENTYFNTGEIIALSFKNDNYWIIK